MFLCRMELLLGERGFPPLSEFNGRMGTASGVLGEIIANMRVSPHFSAQRPSLLARPTNGHTHPWLLFVDGSELMTLHRAQTATLTSADGNRGAKLIISIL